MKTISLLLLFVVSLSFGSCQTDEYARATNIVDKELLHFNKAVSKLGDVSPVLVSTLTNEVMKKIARLNLTDEQRRQVEEYYVKGVESYIKQY